MTPRRAVTHRDEKVAPDEEGGLARLDRVVVEIGGARDDEQLVAIGFDLGKLIGLERILDRERVESEALRDAFELARRDRKRGVSGQSVSVGVDIGGRRVIKKKKKIKHK